jgi:hypothetical protein
VGAPSDKEAFDDDLDRLERADKLPLPYRLNRTKEVSGIRPLLRPYDLAHLPNELKQALNRFISAPHLQLTTSNVVFPNTDFSIQVHDDSAVAVALRGDIVETEVTIGDRRYIETHPVAGGESRYAIVRRSDPSVVEYQEWLYVFLDVASSTGFEQQISSGMTTWTSYEGSFVTVNGELKSFVSVHSSSSPSTWEVKILQPGEVGDVPVTAEVPQWAIGKPLMPVSALAR